jgi:hypothetical protein
MLEHRILSLVTALVVALAFATAALAHEGHLHKVLGTVTMAASDHVMLKDKANKDVTVQLDSGTKIVRDKKPAKIEDIKVGVRVVISAVTVKDKSGEKMLAKTVELGPAPAGK